MFSLEAGNLLEKEQDSVGVGGREDKGGQINCS